MLVSSSPHIYANRSIQKIMLNVIMALVPATIYGVAAFGLYSLMIIVACVAACVLTEAIIQKLRKVEVTVNDLSAVVTGLLLGLNMPPEVPIWMPVIGSVFAIAIVKLSFGGIGHNFMNPALGARCFMLISWPTFMTAFTQPFANAIPVSSATVADALSSATPMAILKTANMTNMPSLMDMFTGNIAGSIGEVSALCLIIGGIYLILTKTIRWHIPVVYIATVFVLTSLLCPSGVSLEFGLYQVLGGGLLIGAIFMATDYSSSPINTNAKFIYALLCGILTAVIRIYGGYPEGVSFAILIGNVCAPLLDKLMKSRVYGVQK